MYYINIQNSFRGSIVNNEYEKLTFLFLNKYKLCSEVRVVLISIIIFEFKLDLFQRDKRDRVEYII